MHDEDLGVLLAKLIRRLDKLAVFMAKFTFQAGALLTVALATESDASDGAGSLGSAWSELDSE